MQYVAITINAQNTAMSIKIVQLLAKSNKVVCSLSFHKHLHPLIQYHVAADMIYLLVVSITINYHLHAVTCNHELR